MKRLMDIVSLVGNIVGAALVAWGPPDIAIVGYVFFIFGAMATLWLLYNSTASRSVIAITWYFMAMNIFGIFMRW